MSNNKVKKGSIRYPYGARRIALVGVNPDLSEQKVLI